MKILLINPLTENILSSNVPGVFEEEPDYIPPLGILYIAAYLEKHTSHQIKVLDSQLEKLNYEQLKNKIIEEKPDVVGMTTLSYTLIDVIKTAKLVKEIDKNIKVVLGGPHINIYPVETMKISEIDILVLGEGEKPAKDLVENINNIKNLYQIKGIVFRDGNKIINTGPRELIQNLDEIPFPARHLTPYKKYFSILSTQKPVTTMFTSRGCPYKCLFCDRPHLGKIFRARSAKNVVDEMEECEKMGIKEIFIYDDTFGVDRQRVLDICSEVKKRKLNINWDIRTRVNTVDEEVLKALKEANCKRIHYGVEAGTTKILGVLRKGITLEMAEKAFKLTKKIGIETLGYFMIGSPTETKEDILETIKFAKKLNPDYVLFSILIPYPETDLYRMGLENGIIAHDYWKEFAENPKSGFKPLHWRENFTLPELYNLLKKAYKSFYLRPGYILSSLRKLKSPKDLGQKIQIAINILIK